MSTRWALWLGVAAILLSSSAASAREDGASISALGMGDTVRSVASSTAALFFNPAGMSQLRMYAMESGYVFSNLTNGHVFNASLVDASTNGNIGAGASYSYITQKFNGDKRTGHMFRFGLSTGYKSKEFGVFVGAALRYLKLEWTNHYRLNGVAVDLGALISFKFGLRLGVVGYNLTSVKNSEFVKSLGAGVSYTYKGFVLAFDTLVDFGTNPRTTGKYSWGAEYLIQKIVVIRGGFVLDKITPDKGFTLGLGVVTRYVGVDIGYQQSVDNKKNYILGAVVKGYLP